MVGLWDLEGTADNVNVGAEDGSMVMEGNTDKEGVKEGVDMDNKDDSPERMNEGDSECVDGGNKDNSTEVMNEGEREGKGNKEGVDVGDKDDATEGMNEGDREVDGLSKT